MTDLLARRAEDGAWLHIMLDGPTIHEIGPTEGPAAVSPGDAWVGPAFWDIQFNGRWGVSFSDAELTVERASTIVRSQAGLGSARVCPTLITAPGPALEHGLKTIARACDEDRPTGAMVLGIHLEGPYISERDGYRGAHPLEAVRDPDWDEFRRLQDASGGRITIVTLAPERPGALGFIEQAVAAGLTVALGHTAADGPTLRAAVGAGARLSTHLGNGIATPLPRHPNPIWEQAADDRLFASLIADGHHLDAATLRVLHRVKGPRTILVSDASPLAGLPVGSYGDWAVDPSGKIVVAGTSYLAGSNQALEVGLNTLMSAAGCGVTEALHTVTAAPAALLGRPAPVLAAGGPANLVLFTLDHHAPHAPFRLLRTCVDGIWHDAGQHHDQPWTVWT